MTALSRIEWICRLSLAALWAYQGLVPKLLGPHPQELALAAAAGLPTEALVMASQLSGVIELLFALALLVFRRAAWPYAVSTAAVLGLFLFVAVAAPEYLGTPFNAVAVNGAWLVLGLVGWIACQGARPTD